jgi:hypothetical protein
MFVKEHLPEVCWQSFSQDQSSEMGVNVRDRVPSTANTLTAPNNKHLRSAAQPWNLAYSGNETVTSVQMTESAGRKQQSGEVSIEKQSAPSSLHRSYALALGKDDPISQPHGQLKPLTLFHHNHRDLINELSSNCAFVVLVRVSILENGHDKQTFANWRDYLWPPYL